MPRPRNFDEAQVLSAARDVFRTHGYAATSVDDLCAATGLGRGSLYGAFGDKHSLYLRALDSYTASVIDEVRDELRESAGSAFERLVTHIRKRTRAQIADSKRLGCLLASGASELAATDREIVLRANRTMHAWRKELAATLAEAQRDGDLSPEADTDALANLLLTVLRGSEALRKQGFPPTAINAAADQAIALLAKA